MKKIYMLSMIFEAVFLVVVGIDFFIHSSISITPKAIISMLLIFDGLIYLFFLVIRQKSSLYRILFIGFILANIILTFTDQVGFADILVLAINLVIIVIYFTAYDKIKCLKKQ